MTGSDPGRAPGRLRFGVSVYDVSPAALTAVATAAESAGFDSLWLGEHAVLPVRYRSAHPTHSAPEDAADTHYPRIVHESTCLLDPLVTLAAVAAGTSRLRLATGIYLLPLRHPLLTARAATTLHELSGGRFMLGVGAGWLEEEFDALGVPFAERGGRHEESVEVLRAAFRGGPIEHHGRYFDFEEVQVSPDPVGVPIVMGGNSAVALRRAARLGDAWFSSGSPSFDEAVRLRDRLEELSAESGRSAPLEYYVRLASFNPALAGLYVEAGFTNLVFWAQDICPAGEGVEDAFVRGAMQLREELGQGSSSNDRS